MSLKNQYFTDGHAYIFALGYKVKISCDTNEYCKVKTGFKVELTHIKINNTWKDYSTYINELVTITGLPFATIDKTYKQYIFEAPGNTFDFEALFYKSKEGYAKYCYDLFDGVWHNVSQSEYEYAVHWTTYVDGALGDWNGSSNKTITDMILTIEPQYAKFPTSVSEFIDYSDYSTTNSKYTGSKVCTTTNIFGFVDLGVCPKSITYKTSSGFVSSYYREAVAEYTQCFGHPIIDYGFKNCTLYSKVTISNYSLYNNKSFILCAGRTDTLSSNVKPGEAFSSKCRAFCYREVHSTNVYNNDGYSTDLNDSSGSQIHYCADLKYVSDISNIDTNIYSRRTNKHEYYTKRLMKHDSYSISITTDSVEIIKKGKYKINFTLYLTTDYQDVSDIFNVMLDVNGNKYTIPYKTSSTKLYLIVETNESLFVYNASHYIASKPTNNPHKYATGSLSAINIKTNNILLPKESTKSFGFKINHTNHTVTIADTDVNIAQCIAARQLAFRPDTSDPFILSVSNSGSISFYIIVDTDVNSINSNTVFTIIMQHRVSSTPYTTLLEAKQGLKQLDVTDYTIKVLNQNITIHRFAFITTGSSYYADLYDDFEINTKQSNIDYLLTHLGVDANNRITVV